MSSVMRFDEWQDSNGVPVLDATGLAIPASALPTGTILQVVSTTKTDTFSSSVAGNGNVAVTGLAATITPTSASSKILVITHVSGSLSVSNYGIGFLLFRGATQIALGTGIGSRKPLTALDIGGTSGDGMSVPSMTHLDSPATTTATTYSVNVYNYQTGTNTVHVNRTATDTDNGAFSRGVSSITVMEVAA